MYNGRLFFQPAALFGSSIMKRVLILVLVLAAAIGAAGCGGAKAPAAGATADEPASVSAQGKATADETQSAAQSKKTNKKQTSTAKASKKSSSPQASAEKAQPTTLINPGEIFSKLHLLFERSGTGWGAYLRVNPDGSFSMTYQKTEKAKTSTAKSKINTSAFTGRFSDIAKINDYFYSMRVTNVKFKEKTGTKKQNNVGDFTYTNETLGLEDGSTVFLYAPNTPVSKLPSGFLYYSKVPKGIPNGEVLGGYCFQATDGKPYYSQNK